MTIKVGETYTFKLTSGEEVVTTAMRLPREPCVIAQK
jgi:hypothetical protein